MKLFSLYLFLLISVAGFAQKPFYYPQLKVKSNSAAAICPQNWLIIDQVNGDLNHDGQADLALILEYDKMINESRVYGDNTSDIIKEVQKPRILAIYFKESGTEEYRLSTQNNDFILRASEGGKVGEPLQKMGIKDNQLYLRFQGGSDWRWELGYTFSYENTDWYLTSAISLYFNQNSGKMTERIYDFKTRQLFTTNGNLHWRNTANVTRSEVLYFSKMRTFKTFKKPWAWEIMPDVYL